MKTNILAKLLVFTLTAFLCLQSVSLFAFAEDVEGEPIIVIAGSDFQAETLEQGVDNVKKLSNSIKRGGYDHYDGFLFCGDYSREYNKMDAEIAALKNTVMTEFGKETDENMIFLKGNHDPNNSKGLTKSGANDSEHYGVFVINESDYMWYNKSEIIIKNIAKKLDAYLKEKSENGYDKPIFIASHLSLAYSKRTYKDGDGKFAKYIFDLLNKYGEKLNIIFLYGHNHNNQYDDYLGGTTVYLTKGDEIFISKLGKPTETTEKHTLNFTYLNAGYVSSPYCLNEEISMTVFEITDNEVVIKRFNEAKQIPLKTKGVWAESLDETAEFFGATDDYLLTEYKGSDYVGLGATDNGVTVISKKLTSLKADVEKRSEGTDAFTAYLTLKLEGTGYTAGEKALVKMPLPEGFNAKTAVFIKSGDGEDYNAVFPENGRLVFETNKLGKIDILQAKPFSVGSGVSSFCFEPAGNIEASETAASTDLGKLYLVSKYETETVEITASMLKDKNGNPVPMTAGVYADLDVYQGEKVIFSGFTLSITANEEAENGDMTAVWIIIAVVAVVAATTVVIMIVKRKKTSK